MKKISKAMLLIGLIPIIGSPIVFFTTMIKLFSARKWFEGIRLVFLFGFLFVVSWIIATFLALACSMIFIYSIDESIFIFVLFGFAWFLTPWAAWLFNVKVKQLIKDNEH